MKEEIDPTMDNTEWQKGVKRGRQILEKRIEVFIKAILNPDLEKIEGLDEITTEDLLVVAKNLPLETILGLAMKHPQHTSRYGFILNPRAFGIAQSPDRLAQIMTVLLNRFADAQKNISDWEKHVCRLRKAGE